MHPVGPMFVLTAGRSIKHSQGTQRPCPLTSDTRFEEWWVGKVFQLLASVRRAQPCPRDDTDTAGFLISISDENITSACFCNFVTGALSSGQTRSVAFKRRWWISEAIRMEAEKRDMELLSNSMATYAHVKGKNIQMGGLPMKLNTNNACNSNTSQRKNSQRWFLGWTVPLRRTGKFW